MKYSWKGHKDRNKHKNRIKRGGQARLVCIKNINRNITTTWRGTYRDGLKVTWSTWMDKSNCFLAGNLISLTPRQSRQIWTARHWRQKLESWFLINVIVSFGGNSMPDFMRIFFVRTNHYFWRSIQVSTLKLIIVLAKRVTDAHAGLGEISRCRNSSSFSSSSYYYHIAMRGIDISSHREQKHDNVTSRVLRGNVGA